MITVMMPARNNRQYIKKSIDSILNQTHKDFELIIVDDCSSEPIWDILEEYKKNDSRVRIYKNSKKYGIPYTLNMIYDLSRGDVFCRQDNDDISHPQRLEKQLAGLKYADMSLCRYRRIDNKDKEISDTWIEKANVVNIEDIINDIDRTDYIVGGAPMWSREVFYGVGYFDLEMKIAQCYNYWIRIIKRFKINICEDKLYYHRRHKGSHRTDTNNACKDKNGKNIDFLKLAQDRAITNPIIFVPNVNQDTVTPAIPYIVHSAKEYLDTIVKPTDVVFEYGSGGSTLYFTKKGCLLTSTEHIRSWAKKIEYITRDFGNNKVVCCEPTAVASSYVSNLNEYKNKYFDEYVKVIDGFEDNTIDIVFIDGRCRNKCIYHAISKVKSGGYILLDNTEHKFYEPGIDLLSSWDKKTFYDNGPHRANKWETTIWKKK